MLENMSSISRETQEDRRLVSATIKDNLHPGTSSLYSTANHLRHFQLNGVFPERSMEGFYIILKTLDNKAMLSDCVFDHCSTLEQHLDHDPRMFGKFLGEKIDGVLKLAQDAAMQTLEETVIDGVSQLDF